MLFNEHFVEQVVSVWKYLKYLGMSDLYWVCFDISSIQFCPTTAHH